MPRPKTAISPIRIKLLMIFVGFDSINTKCMDNSEALEKKH